jgi:hypothetical protein
MTLGTAFIASIPASASCHCLVRRHPREAADVMRTLKAVAAPNAIEIWFGFIVTFSIPPLVDVRTMECGLLWGITLPRLTGGPRQIP